MTDFSASSGPVKPEDAIDASELMIATLGLPEQMAAWTAHLMLTVDAAAESDCPCEGCTELRRIKNEIPPWADTE